MYIKVVLIPNRMAYMYMDMHMHVYQNQPCHCFPWDYDINSKGQRQWLSHFLPQIKVECFPPKSRKMVHSITNNIMHMYTLIIIHDGSVRRFVAYWSGYYICSAWVPLELFVACLLLDIKIYP